MRKEEFNNTYYVLYNPNTGKYAMNKQLSHESYSEIKQIKNRLLSYEIKELIVHNTYEVEE